MAKSLHKNPHWEALKQLVLRRCKGRCEDCGGKLLPNKRHLHHLTYVRRGKELPEDVQMLCLGCHGKRHPTHNFEQPSARKKKPDNRQERYNNWKRWADDFWYEQNGRFVEKIETTSAKPAPTKGRRYVDGQRKFG